MENPDKESNYNPNSWSFKSAERIKKGTLTGFKYLIPILAAVFISASCVTSWDHWEIDNPYAGVDWDNHVQYKANFHTHTTRSDGSLDPNTVVEQYHALGYQILAITDHNLVTYPWTGFWTEPSEIPSSILASNAGARGPETLEMIDIQANELSTHHHMGSFFNDYLGFDNAVLTATYSVPEKESIQSVGNNKGIIMLFHPGRYDKSIQWYVDIYNNFSQAFGLEIYNQGDRYPQDRKTWDEILTLTMPHRPVWGYSNDDMHAVAHLGRNYNMMILPNLSHRSVRQGMMQGLSYYVYMPEGHQGPAAPFIENIRVNSNLGLIAISARDYERIVWISEGKQVHEGNVVNLNELRKVSNYIRAEIHGSGNTIVGTQPFGIRQQNTD